MVAAVYLGIGQGALEAASDYANGRVPSGLGQPIATQAHIQQWIGEIEVALEAARAVLYQTARAWVEQPDQRQALGPHVAAAKHLVTNTACAVTEKALRVAGGFSLTRALPLERHFRDARGGLFQPPQDDLALSYIGRTVLAGRPGRQPVAPRSRGRGMSPPDASILGPWFDYTINGLVIGNIYALLAVGLALIFGVSHLINFAHGSVYMVGAYIGWLLHRLSRDAAAGDVPGGRRGLRAARRGDRALRAAAAAGTRRASRRCSRPSASAWCSTRWCS